MPKTELDPMAFELGPLPQPGYRRLSDLQSGIDDYYTTFQVEQIRRNAVLAYAKAIGEGWQPIETAPKDGREMYVVKGFNVTNPNVVVRGYTTDAYCVWPGDHGGWIRWPHSFPPTHWMRLPANPQEQP